MSQIERTIVIHEGCLDSKGDKAFRTIKITGEEDIVNELAKILSETPSLRENLKRGPAIEPKARTPEDVAKNRKRRILLGIGTNPVVIGQV